jgi:hypothetical protein
MGAQRSARDEAAFCVEIFQQRRKIISVFVLGWLAGVMGITYDWLSGRLLKLPSNLIYIVLTDGLMVLLMPILLWMFLRFIKAVNYQSNAGQDILFSTHEWFQFFADCIPKSWSEPWLGDLREKRQQLALSGRSQQYIAWVTAIEVILLILSWVIEKAVDLLKPIKKS